MRLRPRFILIGIWIVVFLITTPVIVLFALGYKFDFESRQIIKTGSLIARTNPERADIYIDDKLQKSKTNSTIRFILPGDYNIQLSKDGYQSWTKRLNVRSALVTWAAQGREFITLFFTTPKLVTETQFESAAVLPADQTALTVQEQTVRIYTAQESARESFNLTSAEISLAENLNQTSRYYYLSHPASRVFDAPLLNPQGRLQSNGQRAALLANSELYVTANNAPALLASNVSGFLLEDNQIWYTQDNALLLHSFITGQTDTITPLPYSPNNSTIVRGNSQIFLVLDQTAYALNDQLEEIYRGVTQTHWNGGLQKLVISNSNEALLFDPQSFRSELIIRSSTVISNVIANQTTGYLFFINENKIKAIELDGRDHRNVYTITDNNPQSFVLSDNGRYISLFTDSQRQFLQIR